MSSIYFKEEHILLQTMIRDFAKNEIAPLAKEIDDKECFPAESML